ncbi:UNVERIFIED_CONTAM: hypothetical protein PYX00_010397 [Menopon gallinae]|uniref:phosphatidate phosphatase n=1 Tax=Menopon gallinae TaxID=328185 RepID=A0AAW2HFH0_9NEOP
MNSMNYIGKFISNFRDFYNEINAATLTGAIDVVVVEQPDGSFACSPFHVRFGKLGVLRSREKIVDIEINGEPLNIHMKLGDSGEAFFVEEVYPNEEGDEEVIPPHLACSPIPSHDQIESWMKVNSESKPYFDWENNEKDKFSALTAKVFVAETINQESNTEDQEKVRKLSTAAGEFRTIENQENEILESCSSDIIPENDVLAKESPKVISSEGSSNSSSTSLGQLQYSSGDKQNSKRKRRKKSFMKKKNNSSNSSRENTIAESSSVPSSLQQDISSLCEIIPDEKTQEDIIPDTFGESGQENLKSCSTDSLNELSRLPLSNEPDFHFFSDTELTPGCSPDSRPCSPIASDTEIEQRRHEEQNESGSSVVSQSWKWGELPSPLPRSQQVSSTKMSTPLEATDEEAVKKQQQDEAQRSMLSGMFSFMKKTKHLRLNSQTEGIYLSDLNSEELDPEIAAVYFPHSYRGETKQENEGHNEEDAESGNGPSIPHSPNSQSPHTIGGSDLWSSALKSSDIAMSLCGHLDSDLTDDFFYQFVVSYDDFVNNPLMIQDPNLVVRIDGKYYNWKMACVLIVSSLLYKKAIPQSVIDVLANELMPQENKKDKVKVSEGSRSMSSWFNWRRSGGEAKSKKSEPELKPAEEPFAGKEEVNETRTECETVVPQIEDKIEKEEKEEGYAGSNSSEESDEGQQKPANKIPMERRYYHQGVNDKCRKTLRLSSEQIASLNLQDGANEVVFSVTTAYQGTTRCKCHIYKWKHNDRIVISDIDGTITKSDVLGHILPIVGKDWAQSGVAQLFTKIKNNGYKLLYLSARAIGQARVTRDYLKSIKQGDLSLPDGPLLLNPTSLISAFHREVIEKKPEEFKISCLRDIAALFPPEVKPFYAGYGNRVNDVWAYSAVGIPIVRIFTINYKGELKHELTQTFQSSYTNMCHLVDEMFPPPPEELSEDFSNFMFWRDPIPELDHQQILITNPKQDTKSKKN